MELYNGKWRYFEVRELRDALMWTQRAGISVFNPGVPFCGFPSARLLAHDLGALDAAANELGIGLEFLQIKANIPELTHFILFGEFLAKAKFKCEEPITEHQESIEALRNGAVARKPLGRAAKTTQRQSKRPIGRSGRGRR